ncbi:MAG: hypothetical protein Q8O88_06080 [bacterium]|nr:hypothetical protein [bacterium]
MNDTLFLSLSHSTDIPLIDLHESVSVVDALDQLEKELFNLSRVGHTYVKIAYGIGDGVLKENVLNILKSHPLIEDFKASDGFCIAIL